MRFISTYWKWSNVSQSKLIESKRKQILPEKTHPRGTGFPQKRQCTSSLFSAASQQQNDFQMANICGKNVLQLTVLSFSDASTHHCSISVVVHCSATHQHWTYQLDHRVSSFDFQCAQLEAILQWRISLGKLALRPYAPTVVGIHHKTTSSITLSKRSSSCQSIPKNQCVELPQIKNKMLQLS